MVHNPSFFSNDTLLNTVAKGNQVILKRHQILEAIKKNPDCTIYKIAKITKTNYSQMFEIMKLFVFAGLVAVRFGFDSNDEMQELFFIPEDASK